MRTVAVIQARLGSSRLPGKILMEVNGRPLLSYLLERARGARSLDEVVVATTTEPKDDAIVQLCARENVPVFRGDENDVLDRYYRCALDRRAETVVRLTSDNPIIDPRIIDLVVEAHRARGCDYTCNSAPPVGTYPDGMNVEVFTFAALERAWREARKPSEREHVTFYLWKTGLFKTFRPDRTPSLSQLRLTVDYPQDFEVVAAILRDLYPKDPRFTLEDVAAYLEAHPEVRALNAEIERNAGWKPSLARDRELET